MPTNDMERMEAAIQRLFRLEAKGRTVFVKSIEKLHKTYGDSLFVDLLFASAHLDFAPRTAKKHYQNILSHWEKMNAALEREVDFRVALLDYFVSINKRINNPTIIELKILRKTQQETEIDELTQLFNFRYLKKTLDIEVARATRYQAPLSLVLFDVDDFKHYNDRNGHLAGNKALKKFARLLKQSVRNVDFPARFGGEEFALLLPETEKEGALVIADRIRQSVAKAAFSYGTKQPLKRFTVSGGLATLHQDATNSDDLIAKADQALYQAKARGKNQVAIFVTEHRQCERVSTSLTALVGAGKYKGEMLLLQDISESGFAFHFNKAIPAQESLQLGLELPGRKKRITCTVLVRRVRSLPGKAKFEIGASIASIEGVGKKAVRDFVHMRLEKGDG